MYKVNMHPHGNAAKVYCMSFLRDNNKAYFTHYYYKRLFDLDKPGETFTILLTERDMNVVIHAYIIIIVRIYIVVIVRCCSTLKQ